jgi:hypothetical protein
MNYLNKKVKIKGELHAYARLLENMRDLSYEIPPGRITMCQLLFLNQVENVFLNVREKLFKGSRNNKEEMSLSLTLPELLSIWQLSSRVNTEDPFVIDLIHQIDQEAVNHSHLVDYKNSRLIPPAK